MELVERFVYGVEGVGDVDVVPEFS